MKAEERTGEILFKEEVYKIVGAAMDVHTELGCGFMEAVYQEAIERELQNRQIPFVRQKHLTIFYKGQALDKTYIPDLVCYSQIVVELKAIDHLAGREEAQLLNYLKATRMRVGLLINFGSIGKLEWKRLIR
jgi:GxxExxY protein